MRHLPLVALACLLLVACARSAELVDDPALGTSFTSQYPGYLHGTRAVSPLGQPGEVALQQIAPVVSQVRYSCSVPALGGHATLEYVVRLRDGRAVSGSTRRTCAGASRAVEVNVTGSNQLGVRTEAAAPAVFSDFTAAIAAAATSFR